MISLIIAKGVGLTHAMIILVDLAFNVHINVANYPSLTVRGLVKRICKGKYKQTKISFRQTRTQANNDMTDCLTELSRVYSYQKALDL